MATIPSTLPPLKFNGAYGFNPNYTPREILEFGVFGGAYFFTTSSRKNIHPHLFKGLNPNLYRNQLPDTLVNYFEVNAPQRRREDLWLSAYEKSLSREGWFQWYCKFFYRASKREENAPRFKQAIEEIKTFVYYIDQACQAAGVPFSDLSLESVKVWRQQMLQFGYDPSINPFVPPALEGLTYGGELLTYNGEIVTYGN